MHKIKYILLLLLLLSGVQSQAQCAMCRAQLESMDDNSMAEGINNGIVFLMAMPYILLGLVGYFVYKALQKRKNK